MHIVDEMEDKELIQQALRVGGKEAVSNMQVSNIAFVLADISILECLPYFLTLSW